MKYDRGRYGCPHSTASFWQGERFENHVFSIKNNTPYTFTIWDRISGGGEAYTKLFVSPPGNKGNFDLAGGRRADAIAFDPNPNTGCPQPARVIHMSDPALKDGNSPTSGAKLVPRADGVLRVRASRG
jgi:hypothetical protein